MEAVVEQMSAFSQLLGLQAPPHSVKDVLPSITSFSNTILQTTIPIPLLTQLIDQKRFKAPSSHKQRFIDVRTGMRLRYLEWPGNHNEIIILLHDIAESADIFESIGDILSDRGYNVISIDLRGHGGSSWSSDQRYSASILAEDIQAFIVAKDLYVRPVAVLGCGIGGCVALTLAQSAPSLIGAVIVAEFGLPPEVVSTAQGIIDDWTERQASTFTTHEDVKITNTVVINNNVVKNTKKEETFPQLSSEGVMPWWSFWFGQAAEFDSIEECAAFVSHPLLNLGPSIYSALTTAASNAAQRTQEKDKNENGPSVQQILATLGRSPKGAVSTALSILQGGVSASNFITSQGRLKLSMDPKFWFSFDIASFLHHLPHLTSYLLLIHGENSAWIPQTHAYTIQKLATSASVASTQTIPGVGRPIASEGPTELATAIASFLEGPAVLCFQTASSQALNQSNTCTPTGSAGVDGRRPEVLGIRPLPVFESVEAAKKALGPRQIPSAAAIEDELKRLNVENGWCSDDEEGADTSGQRTALALDPPNYFGFVG